MIDDPNLMRDKLKRIFRGYRSPTAKMYRQLLALNMTLIHTSGGHFAILGYAVSGKEFVVTISSTSGDSRAGLNIVAQIMRYRFNA